MNDFADAVAAQRRLALLRLLAELNAEANEAVLRSAIRAAGYGQASIEDVRADLDHLHSTGCTRETWIGTTRIAVLTPRGDDVAYGRLQVAGVAHERWERA